MKKNILIISVIFILLAGFNAWAVFFYAPKICLKNEIVKNSKYNFLNPARSIYKQENLIVNIQPLRDELSKFLSDPNISIYFEYLPTGANISINKDAEFFPASLLKLPVAIAAAKKVETGLWQWRNELVLMRSDSDDKFGDLYQNKIGTPFSIEYLVEKSLAESDNTAYRILLRNLDQGDLEDLHKHLGLEKFFSEDGKISAKKYSIIIRSLYSSSFLDEEYSQKILAILSETKFNEYLAAGLPEGTAFSHKIGISDEQDVVLDAGIVYLPGRPYLLSVMIKDENIKEGEKKMKDISQRVYNYISAYLEQND